MTDRCMKCFAPVPSDDGYENSIGETLCNSCYVDLWGPRLVAVPDLEELTPDALDHSRGSLA